MATSRPTKAQNKTSSKRNSNSKTNMSGKSSFLHDMIQGDDSAPISRRDTIRLVAGALLVLTALFSLLSFVSFLFTWDNDMKMFQPGGNNVSSENWMGYIGAWWGNYWINRNFGLGAMFIPFVLLAAGLKCIGDYGVRLWKWFVNCAFLMIWVSVAARFFLQSLFASSPKTDFISAGGIHGERLVGIMEQVVGSVGTFFVIIVTMVAYLCYVSAETYRQVRRMLHPQRMMRELREDHPWFDKSINAINSLSMKVTEDDDTEKSAENEEDEEDKEEAATKTEDTDDIPTAELEQETEEDWITVEQGEEPATTDSAQSTEDTDHKDSGDIDSEVELEIVPTIEEEQADIRGKAALEPYDPKLDLSMYRYPTLDLLQHYDTKLTTSVNDEEYTKNKQQIENVLKSFGVTISKIRARIGPTITLYEITPAPGVRISKIRNLEDDIALSLAALGIRIIAPIPGQGTIGIEVPNANPQIVSMESILNSRKFQESTFELPMALGKTITNEVFMVDLAKMPHLLVAGATGQGKSVGLNAIITSLLYKKHPAELKLVMVDPKKVEFSIYSPIVNHFLAQIEGEDDEPIITDVQKVINTLKSLCVEMDARYDLLKRARARNLKEYNEKFKNRLLLPEKGHRFMPYIVVIIDEFGDLIMTAGKEIELPIARIAQLARAVGIHMIIATQRPTTNIITGTIKANFPARMAFKVSAMIDSRTILDRPGANQLVGKGDMLFLAGNDPVRVQCAFVDTPEVENICSFIACQQSYGHPFALPRPPMEDAGMGGASDVDMQHLDPMFAEAAQLIVQTQQGSTSMIQRKFAIGYNRAGRLMDQLEKAGVVGSAQGSKPREVLIQDEMSLEILLNNLN